MKFNISHYVAANKAPIKMNFMTPKKFSKQNYVKYYLPDLFQSEINNLCNQIDNAFGFTNFLANANLSGGFVVNFGFQILKITKDTSLYSDIDIYLPESDFNILKQNSAIVHSGHPDTPVLNWYMPWKNGDIKVQFICMFDKTISQIVDSFDISTCQMFINLAMKCIFISKKIVKNPTGLHIHHTNGNNGAKLTFKRMEKYMDRYPFITDISFEKSVLKNFVEYKLNGVKVVTPPPIETLEKDKKEYCPMCNEELKWILLQLKCPTCQCVFAG